MNPVLILSYNNLEALKACVDSVLVQDIDTMLAVVDNASTDGSSEWLAAQTVPTMRNNRNLGVSVGWNQGLMELFAMGANHVLVLNQDVVLPAYGYRELLAFDMPFVTGRPVETEAELETFDRTLVPCPCFSAFLIRRDCWETVGRFNEQMFAWAGDCDYHVRAHLLGVPLMKSEIPFMHHAGTTMRTAEPEQKKWFGERANADRAVFKSIYGCEPGEPGYARLFDPALFGVRRGIHSR